MVLIELYKTRLSSSRKETIKVAWAYGFQCDRDWSRLSNIRLTRFYKVKLNIKALFSHTKAYIRRRAETRCAENISARLGLA